MAREASIAANREPVPDAAPEPAPPPTDLTAAAFFDVDNTLMQGQPWGAGPSTENGAAIAAFNQALIDDPRVEQVLVPVRDVTGA